jgi:hypothetical protein
MLTDHILLDGEPVTEASLLTVLLVGGRGTPSRLASHVLRPFEGARLATWTYSGNTRVRGRGRLTIEWQTNRRAQASQQNRVPVRKLERRDCRRGLTSYRT